MVEGDGPVVEAHQEIGQRLIVDSMGREAFQMPPEVIGEIAGRTGLEGRQARLMRQGIQRQPVRQRLEGIAGETCLSILDQPIAAFEGAKGLGHDEGIARERAVGPRAVEEGRSRQACESREGGEGIAIRDFFDQQAAHASALLRLPAKAMGALSRGPRRQGAGGGG